MRMQSQRQLLRALARRSLKFDHQRIFHSAAAWPQNRNQDSQSRTSNLGSRKMSFRRSPTLGDFKIDSHSPLGFGAHSLVYCGQYLETQGRVAVKVMSPHAPLAGEPEQISRGIASEERVVQKLLSMGEQHPNVVDLVTQFVAPGYEARDTGFILPSQVYENPIHVCVTEYLGGGSLADAMHYRKSQGEVFEEDEVIEVALAVGRGISFLHQLGIAHRDVKPANLIYSTSRKDLKLIDFSLAETAPTGRTLQPLQGDVGTEGYVAPEVMRCSYNGGEPTSYGPSCDVFSLGCVLHEMLVGETPTVELLPDSSRVVCSLPEHLSDKMRNFVESLLAVDPTERPESSEIAEFCLDVAQGESR